MEPISPIPTDHQTAKAGLRADALLLLLGIVVLVLMLGNFIRHQIVDVTRHKPQHIVLADAACHELRSAKFPDGRPASAALFPCSFTGYVFNSGINGLYVIFGVSENIKGQCMTLAGDVIDAEKTYVDLDYPTMATLPKQCEKEAAIFSGDDKSEK